MGGVRGGANAEASPPRRDREDGGGGGPATATALIDLFRQSG
jgi:hypothetical protein